VDLPQKVDPEQLARLGSLAIKARVIVEGALSGMHRASMHGSSVEFAEHKEYSPGDEPCATSTGRPTASSTATT
jgi:hypothetical protein